MVRKEISFVPKWEGPISGWTVNHIRKNYWRFANSYEFEDLLQEARIKFIVCKRKYPEVVSPKHFMALYKSAVTRQFHTLAEKEMHRYDSTYLSPKELSDHDDMLYEKDHNLGPLFTEISEFPQEIQELIVELIKNPDTKKQNVFKFRGKFKRRITTNEYFCKLVGKDPTKYHMADTLRELLRNVSSTKS